VSTCLRVNCTVGGMYGYAAMAVFALPGRKPSIYPAWRLPTNPAFIPLGAS